VSTGFPLEYDPERHDDFLAAVGAWLSSDAVGWLLDNVPTFPDAERRADPVVLGRPEALRGRDVGFFEAVDALAALEQWRVPGTAWDTRHREERQAVDFAFEHGHVRDEDVRARANELGMRSSRRPTGNGHRAAVALGGARVAPLNRTQWLVAHLADPASGVTADHLVALGSNRPLDPERELALDEVHEYGGDDPRTESDLMEGALRFELGLPAAWDSFEEAGDVGTDDKTHWMWKRCRNVRIGPKNEAVDVHLVQAPTTDPDRRRVDTAESLEFLAGGVPALEGRPLQLAPSHTSGFARHGLRLGRHRPDRDSVVLSTSAIYGPYTQLVGMRVLGLSPWECRVQTVTHPLEYGRLRVPAFQTGPQYVQEVRSAFQAALDLADELRRAERPEAAA